MSPDETDDFGQCNEKGGKSHYQNYARDEEGRLIHDWLESLRCVYEKNCDHWL